MQKFLKGCITCFVVGGIVVFGLIQLVPFGHDHSNPPTTAEPQWSSPQARAVVKEHCFQCHSNETEWPWYTGVAPASWLTSFDVVAGRSTFNFSEWDSAPANVNELVGAVQEGEMPPPQYWIFHPSARMNDAQKTELIAALTSSIK